MGLEIKCAPRVERMVCCCCSCTLRTATVVLGFLNLAGNFLQIIAQTVKLTYQIPERESEALVTESREVIIGTIAANVVSFLFSALMLYGVFKNKPVFMVPYIIFALIGLIGGTIAIIVLGILIIIAAGAIGILVFVIGGLGLALGGYFWVVIYSYYRQFVEGNTPAEAPLSSFVPQEPPPYEYEKFPTYQKDAAGLA